MNVEVNLKSKHSEACEQRLWQSEVYITDHLTQEQILGSHPRFHHHKPPVI